MYTIAYGERQICYNVVFVQRKTLAISVHPDMNIIIKAPFDTPLEAINNKVTKRARWIVKQQDFFAQYHPKEPPRQYIGGESHKYLGRQYRLKIIQEGKGVKISGGNLVVSATNPKMESVRKILDLWYRQRAAEHFVQSLQRCWKSFEDLGQTQPKIVVKKLEKRWGSLAKSGTLTLNINLIKAPKECIDYVMMHELCHLLFHDHSKAFYDLLQRKMPDWERRKMKLEKYN